jgi:predicted KAP-like P-loop ATPase
MKITLDSDKSVSRLKDDSFQRYGFAKRIAELIKSNTNEDSLVIGIYGRWGEGKTSVMNFISTELKKDKKNVLVKFNPWMFNNEDQLLLSFFQELAIGLNTSMKSKTERVGEFLKTYAKLNWVSYDNFSRS